MNFSNTKYNKKNFTALHDISFSFILKQGESSKHAVKQKCFYNSQIAMIES